MAKKVLFITYDFPWPTTSGGKSRIYNLIKFSKSRDLDFYLYSFTRPAFQKADKKELQDIGVGKIYTHSRKPARDYKLWTRAMAGKSSIFKLLYFEKIVEQELLEIIQKEKIEVVLFESFYTSFYLSDRIRELGVKQIFGTENIEHALYYDFAKEKGSLKKLYMSQVAKIRREEEQAYGKADVVLAVTTNEKEVIKPNTKAQIEVIPNGVNTKDLLYKPKDEITRNILFVGNFSYFPNIDAMKFFYQHVFAHLPGTTLTVIGKYQNKLSFLKRDSRIMNIEYIEDLKSAYYNADALIFPVRFGGGTNFKVLEAASCGIPIIAFPDRVKGLGFTAGKEYLAARTPQEFIDGITSIFEDAKLRILLSKNARSLVEKEYDWKEIGEKLRQVIEKTK